MADEHHMADPPEITEQCVATAKSTGKRCKQPSIDGGNVCRFHGGRASQVEKSAEERLEEMGETLLKKVDPKLMDLFDQYEQAETVKERVQILREIRQWTTDVLDRSGTGPTEKRELTGEDGDPIPTKVIIGGDEY